MKIERILAAVDLEKNSDIVVGAALRLASCFKARLTLLHVSEAMPYFSAEDTKLYPVTETAIGRYRAEAMNKIEEIVGDLDHGVEVNTVVTEGRPVDYILDAVGGGAQDLLVMGTHGRRGVELLLMGSNAARVVRSCPVPVFTVNTREATYRNLELKTIVLATDFSDNSRAAEPWAVALARAFEAEVVLAHVVEERFHPYLPYYVSGVDFSSQFEVYLGSTSDRYQKLSEEAAERMANEGVSVRPVLIEDAVSVSDGLVRAVKEAEAQVLVIGTHGRTGLDRAVLGSVAEKLVRLSPSAVLSVRSPDDEEDDL
jgi:nucleotide-binding universal stress UspA family protein